MKLFWLLGECLRTWCLPGGSGSPSNTRGKNDLSLLCVKAKLEDLSWEFQALWKGLGHSPWVQAAPERPAGTQGFTPCTGLILEEECLCSEVPEQLWTLGAICPLCWVWGAGVHLQVSGWDSSPANEFSAALQERNREIWEGDLWFVCVRRRYFLPRESPVNLPAGSDMGLFSLQWIPGSTSGWAGFSLWSAQRYQEELEIGKAFSVWNKSIKVTKVGVFSHLGLSS